MIYFDTKVSYWKLIVGMAVGIIIGVIVGSGLLVAYPIIIVGGIGALIIIYILIKSPTYETCFLVMIFTLPLLLSFVIDIGGNLRVPWILSLLALAFAALQNKLKPISQDYTHLLLILFVFYVALSAVWTFSIDLSGPMADEGFRLTPFRFVVQFGQMLLMILSYYLTVNYVTSFERLEKVANVLSMSLVAVIIYGMYEFIAGITSLPFFIFHNDPGQGWYGADSPILHVGDVSLTRVRSTLPEPIDFSLFLLFMIPITWAYISNKKKGSLRWLCKWAIGIGLLLFFAAQSRAAFVSLGIMYFFFLCFSGGHRARLQLLGLSMIAYLAAAFILLPLGGGEFDLRGPMKFSAERLVHLLYDTDIWKVLVGETAFSPLIGRNINVPLDVWKENPIFGVGIGNYTFMHPRASGIFQVSSTYSTLLRLLTELGIVGTTLFLLFLGRILWLLARLVLNLNDGPMRRYALAILLGTIGHMFGRFVGLDGLYTDNYLWVMFGLGYAIAKLCRQSQETNEECLEGGGLARV